MKKLFKIFAIAAIAVAAAVACIFAGCNKGGDNTDAGRRRKGRSGCKRSD